MYPIYQLVILLLLNHVKTSWDIQMNDFSKSAPIPIWHESAICISLLTTDVKNNEQLHAGTINRSICQPHASYIGKGKLKCPQKTEETKRRFLFLEYAYSFVSL